MFNRLWASAALTALAILATGCSDDVVAAGSGPVTVTHARGETVIESEPSAVVALGSGDVQIASALGANIVGAVRNPTSDDGNWTGVSLPDDVLTLDAVTPNIEAIASLEPDLILATTAQAAYGEEYDRLSQIAPVVSYKTALLEDSGDELTELIGTALGRSDRAREIIEESNSAIADFAGRRTDLDGKQYAYGQFAGGTLYLLGKLTSPSAIFLSQLGLRIDDAIASAANADSPFVTYGPENFSVVAGPDIAMVSVYGPPDAFTSIVDAPDLVLVDQEFSSAMLFPNPATTDYLLGRLDEILPA
jgi:iron complex transport system substrate-binding protein